MDTPSLGNYGQRVGDRIAKFSAFFGLERLEGYNEQRREPALGLINELSTAWSDVPFMLSWVSDPSIWNIQELLEHTTEHGEGVTKFRKPKLEITAEITQAGNLSVRWLLVNDDFLEKRFPKVTSRRPSNELLFVRGFHDALVLNNAKNYNLASKMLTTEAVKLCLDAVDEIVKMAQVSCDVEFSQRVLLKYSDDGKIAVFYEHVSAEEIERRAKVPIQEEVDRLEAEINMPIDRLLGLSASYMDIGCSSQKVARILVDHYGLQIAEGRSFAKLLDRCGSLNHSLGRRVKAIELTEEQLALEPVKKVKSGDEIHTALLGRVAAYAKPEKSVAASTIPVYPNRTFEATADELAPFGVQDVRALVDKFNQYQIEQGRLPLSQADYPTNRRAFEKLLQRAESVGLLEKQGTDFKI